MEVQVHEVEKFFRLPRSESNLKVLGPVTLQVPSGTFVTIVGPSGCGKSTLLKMLAGFESCSAGTLSIGGKPVAEPTPRVAMVFQEYALLPWKTAYENIELSLKYRGAPERERKSVVAEYVELVGLKGFEAHYPHELSGGMRQRCAIARTLVSDPTVLLMDEPFGALDAQTREILQEQLLRIWGEVRDGKSRKTVLFVTHSIDEAILLSDRIVIMTGRPGQILSVFDNPLPRPRPSDIRVHPEFARIRQQLWGQIKEEALRALSQGF
jgi:NitT/TauT family transport system ATP-binding protein